MISDPWSVVLRLRFECQGGLVLVFVLEFYKRRLPMLGESIPAIKLACL